MRKLIVVLVLAAVGYGIWWWLHRAPDAPAEDPFATTPVTTQAAVLPVAAKKALDEAESLWAQAGSDPAAAPNAPRMAALFSQVLEAMYNLPGNHDAEAKLVADRLTPLGKALFFSKTRYVDDASGLIGVHVVSPGENPTAIAKTYGMSGEFLNLLRGKGVTDSGLRSGETLKVVKAKDKGGYGIHIDLSDYILDLSIGGVFAKRYVISHGAVDSPTPTGRTMLTDRVWHPPWTHPKNKQVYAYGEAENILGPIWLPFDAKTLGASGIGIHGYTGADGKMQAQVSNGCVRMQNQDAEELFNIISHPQRAPTAVAIAR